MNQKLKTLDEKYDEKRDRYREPVNIVVDYTIAGRIRNEFITDLSDAGVFIETQEPLDVGDYIVLTYTNPLTSENVKIGGVVVRTAENGVGVKLNPRSKYDKEKAQQKAEQDTSAVLKNIWGPWATLGLGMAIGLIWYFTQIMVLAVSAVIRVFPNTKLTTAQYAEMIQNDSLSFFIATCIAAVICIFIIYVFIKIREGADFKEYLNLHRISGKTILSVMGITLGFIALSTFVNIVFEKSPNSQFMTDSIKTVSSPLLMYIALILAAPIAEEFFFRGFLMEGFRHTWIGNTGAITITSFLWSVIHQQYDAFGQGTLFFLGILLGIIRIRTGSLWSSVVMHSFNNLVATVMLVLHVNSV